jgi:hypothetical protein
VGAESAGVNVVNSAATFALSAAHNAHFLQF